MNGRGMPGDGYGDHGYWGDPFEASTDWFMPVDPAPTAVGLLERPDEPQRTPYPAADHPSFPPGALDITPADVYDALGPQADELMDTAEVDVDELIRLINAETTVMPPLVLPEALPETDGEDGPPPDVMEAITAWKRRFLKSAVAAVLLTLTGTGGAAAAMDKSVTVEVDGRERTVNTYESTVGEVLEEEGIDVDKHDVLSPSPQAEIEHGDKITLDRGRLLTLTVDGEQREEWVRSVTVGEALRKLGVDTEGAWISAARSTPVPENGMSLEVRTSKTIKLIDGANEPRQVETTAVTVEELMRQQGLEVGPDDKVTPGSDAKITDGAKVRVIRNGTTVINVTEPVEPPVEEIEDPEMLKGEKKVVDPGKPGEKIVTFRVTTRNGEETGREELHTKIVVQPEPKVVRVGTKQPPMNGVWDKLAQCESGGNWSINTGNGYSGGLQFDKSTWDAYGGDQYAAYPHQATREQQITVAERVREARGDYGAWPACSAELGLN